MGPADPSFQPLPGIPEPWPATAGRLLPLQTGSGPASCRPGPGPGRSARGFGSESGSGCAGSPSLLVPVAFGTCQGSAGPGVPGGSPELCVWTVTLALGLPQATPHPTPPTRA